jgi:hypothetical protein
VPSFSGASSSVVILTTGTACNQAPKAGVSNLKCFADKITYTNHPNDNSCASSSARANELKVGVCTEFPGPVRTWKLIEAATYTCGGGSSTGNTNTDSNNGVCCSDGSAPVSDGDHTTPPCTDGKPPSTEACTSVNAGSKSNGDAGSQKPAGQMQGGQMQGGQMQGGQMQGGQMQGGAMGSMSTEVKAIMTRCKSILASGTTDAALKAECDAFKAKMMSQNGGGGQMQGGQ